MDYNWPGNVRELKNLVERLMVLSPNDIIEISELRLEMFRGDSSEQWQIENTLPLSLNDAIKDFEDRLILEAMRKGGSIRNAAKLLNITPSTLHRKLNRNVK